MIRLLGGYREGVSPTFPGGWPPLNRAGLPRYGPFEALLT
jgi:hypothetical protein